MTPGNTLGSSGQKRGQMSKLIIQLINKFRGKREMTIDEIMLGKLLMRVTNGDPTKKLIIEKTIGKREI